MLRLFLLFYNLRGFLNRRTIIWESSRYGWRRIWRWLIKEHRECCHFLRFILRLVKHVSNLSFLSWWTQEINYVSLLLMPLAMMMMMMFFRVFSFRSTSVSFTLILIRMWILRSKYSMWCKPILFFIAKLCSLFLSQFHSWIHILIFIVQVFFNLVETILGLSRLRATFPFNFDILIIQLFNFLFNVYFLSLNKRKDDNGKN